VVRETLRDRLLAALDDLERALPAGAPLSERIPVRLALGGQVAHERQGRGGSRQAAGVAASKVIRGPVPMSALGGKADIPSTWLHVRF